MKKNNFLFFTASLACILAGAAFAFCSSQVGLLSEHISILDSTGNASTITQIRPAPTGVIYSIISIFFFSLGVSIFISVFVSKRIEESLAADKELELRKIQESINVDVFDSLFKRMVPEDIFHVFKSDVVSNRVLRKNANWIYDFREMESDSTRIELTQTIRYELCNVCHEPVTDAINAVFDGHGDSGLRKALCTLDGKEIAKFESGELDYAIPDQESIEVSEDKTVTIRRTPDGYTNIAIDVEIPPYKQVDVILVYITIYDNNYVNDAYFTKHPMINATLTATYPESYEFDLFQALSSTMKKTLSENNRTIFEVKGGILPKQGIVYTLKKKKV